MEKIEIISRHDYLNQEKLSDEKHSLKNLMTQYL
jgi:hypothetical protein